MMVVTYALLEVLERAKMLEYIEMARNAYRHHDLENVIGRYGYGGDGLRAKVFDCGEELVVAFKGTTVPVGRRGSTARKDRILDEVLFTYCSGDTEECKSRKSQGLSDSGYYKEAVGLVGKVQELYPGRRIVLTGHSLGGAIASLIAMVSGLEAFALASPGEAYAAKLLGLCDRGKSYRNIVHIGMCNDAVFSGECSEGVCGMLGYRIQTRCHVGRAFCIRDRGYKSVVYHSLEAMREKLAAPGPIDIIEAEECSEQFEE
jgi:lipase ATG15